MILTFGPFELDLSACELRRNGGVVPLQPRAFETLRYLIEHRDRVVSKRELFDALWHGEQRVDSTVLAWSVGHARKALDQARSEPGYIRTMRGRGYRFVGVVQTGTGSVVEPRGRLDRDRKAPRGSDPFVGRDDVIQQLTAALDSAHCGRGRLVLISGDPGIGKTRCVQEFDAAMRALGYSAWTGRCVDRAASPAFSPFIQILREACTDPTLPVGDRCEAEVLLQRLVPDRAAAPESESPESGVACFWLLDSLIRFLVRTGTSRTRIVTFDDLHAADENSLNALALLAPVLEHARLLVVAATRDTASEAERSATALALLLKPCERVELTGLTVGDVAHYLGAVLGEAPVDELSRAVHLRTTGNPLFMREAVRIVCEKHARARAVRAEDVALPEAVKGFLTDRLSAVDPATRVVLDAACVMGEEFELLLLQRVTRLAGDSLLPRLQSAEAARIIERRRDGLEHGFVHPLLREVLYDALSEAQRADWHARVGLALETLAVVDLRLTQLAYHFHLASSREHSDRAARYCRLAGDAAMRVFAYDDAAQYYAWALDAQAHRSQADLRDTCELLLASAAALLRAGRRAAWRQQCKRAIPELARESGLADVLVQAARQLRPSVMSAQVPDGLVVAALEEALAHLPDSATEARALAYSRLASIPPYAHDIERSRAMSDEAMRIAQASKDRALLVEALRSRFRSLSGPDSMHELLRVADELLLANPRAQSWWSADALLARYQTLLRLGETAAAERALAMFGRMADKLRERVWGWHHDRMVAHRALREGRLAEAEQQFTALFKESQCLHLPYGAMLYAGQLNALSAERTGRRLSSGTNAAADPWKWAQALPLHRVEHIARALQTGELECARAGFRAIAKNQFAAVTRDSNFLFVMSRLSLAAIALDERAGGQAIYESLTPYAQLFAVSDFSVSFGSVAYFLGGLARHLGRREEAQQHFVRAIERNLETGHKLRAVRSQLALAELLAENRECREREEALALAREVSTTAQSYGVTDLPKSADALIERLSTVTANLNSR